MTPQQQALHDAVTTVEFWESLNSEGNSKGKFTEHVEGARRKLERVREQYDNQMDNRRKGVAQD
jgi:hypothetical protein